VELVLPLVHILELAQELELELEEGAVVLDTFY
jgi:hypothetical protein